MNDYRGLLIKKERKKQDISLEALAYGICSPSYLSKIENNILIADNEIYKLIFQKLGIQTMDQQKEDHIEALLKLFFRYYMASNLKVLKVIDELLEYKDEVSTSSLFVSYQLFLLYASEMNSQSIYHLLKWKRIIHTWMIHKENILICLDYLLEIWNYLIMKNGYLYEG